MAENDRNRSGSRSSNQDWNEGSSRYNRESYDDRGNSGSYTSRYEGNSYGDSAGRYGQDYGEGSTYGGSSRYNRESDYNQGNYAGYNQENYGSQGNYGNYTGRQTGRYNQDDREYYSGSGGSSENRGRDYGSSSYGGFGHGGGGFGSSRYNRDYQTYTPGGYQNYGGGSGYGGSYLGGGYGGTSYGRSYGSEGYGTGSNYGRSYGNEGYGTGSSSGNRSGYGSDFGETYRGNRGNSGYGGYNERSQWDYDQNRGYGSTYGTGYRDRDMNRDRSQDRNWFDRAADEVSSWFGDEEAERRRRMDRHRGKGPKNYQRSDERIKEDINDRLSDDWFIDASDVEVTVMNGEVTLTGKVDDRSTKRRAEDIAEAVSGVKNVENRIRVMRERDYDTTSVTGSSTTAGTSTVGSTSGRSKQSSLVTDVNK